MAVMPNWPKPISITTRLIPNYLWHLLAVAKIGYDSEYAEVFGDTVIPDDLALLKSKKSLLAFAEGEGGELSGFFTMLPAWLPLKDKADLERYFKVLQTALERRNLQPFVDHFPQADWQDRIWAEFLRRDSFPDEIGELMAEAQALAALYSRNLENYQQRIWPQAKSSMQPRQADLQELFTLEDYIAKWEQFLGMEFTGDQYEFVLCYANKNGPDYNSLGYCGNLCYFDKPFKQTWQFLSHEIGTHILMQIYFKLAGTGTFEHRSLYSAYECLAMFYNRSLLNVESLDYSIQQMSDSAHLEFYARIYDEGIEPEKMILKALAAGVT